MSQKNEALFATELSIPEDWNLSSEERYVYAFHNNESPKLLINQISIYGMELFPKNEGGFEATGLIRSTVEQEIRFDPTTILFLDGNKEVIAKKEFDLGELGALPANSARPWTFNFAPSDVIVKDGALPLTEWSLAFELKEAHRLDLDPSWEAFITEDMRASLQAVIDHAAPLEPGEVNFLGLSAQRNEEGGLTVTALIRNGSEQNITLEQLPLGVKDASDEEVAKGGFQLDNFTVKANTSKPWTFVFPVDMIVDKELDLSTWSVYVVQ